MLYLVLRLYLNGDYQTVVLMT